MFALVVVALAAGGDPRDALRLAAPLTAPEGTLLVAHVTTTAPTPILAGTAARASGDEWPHDAREEIYATLGPDPRVRYLPLAGPPFAEAVGAVARREGADLVVVGRSLMGLEPEARALLGRSPCPVAVAPHGQRFVRRFSPSRVTVDCRSSSLADDAVREAVRLAAGLGVEVQLMASHDARSDRSLVRARAIAPAATTVRCPEGGGEALMTRARARGSVLVLAGADNEVLRQAACPVVVVPPGLRR